MVSISIPLDRLLVDAEKEVDLFALPQSDVESLVRDCYSFLPSPLEIRVEDDIAHVKSLKKPAKTASDAPELYRRATKFAEQGSFPRAIEIYGRVLERDPGHVEARRGLGMALLESGETTEGRQKLVEAVRLDPNDPWLYLLLANSFSKHDNQPEKAIRFYQLAYALNPRDPFILASYGGVMIQFGRNARGRELLQEALAVDPTYPNAAYGLALVEFNEGKPREADRVLADLFKRPLFPDRRSIPVYQAARDLDTQANRQIAEKNYDRFMAAVDQRRESLETLGTVGIEVEEDDSIPTHAVTRMAWNHGADKHRILYKNRAKPIVPHYIAHELEHIDLEIEARKVERNRAFVSSAKNRETAIRSMEREINHLQRQGYGESQILETVIQTVNGLTGQLFNIPLDMLIEWRVHRLLSDLRPAQFVSLYITLKEIEQIYSNPEIRKLTLPTIYDSSAALNFAYALFTDWLFEGRSNFGETFKTLSGFSRDALKNGEKIFALFRDMIGPGGTHYKHGDEYAFVDRVAELLGLQQWYEWRFQGETGEAPVMPSVAEVLSVPDHPQGTTNPELLRSKDMATVMYLLSAMKRFNPLTDSDVQKIAFETAMVGRGGIDYSDPDRRYHLQSAPGEEFSGLQLLALMYVGFKRIAPEMDTGLDFAEPYETAQQLYSLENGNNS